jgi:long-chain fatty acid transport protein
MNYGKNPIPREHLSPILAAILEWHWTLGARWRLSPAWSLTAGLEYQVGNSVTYTNPQSIFGPNSTERAKGIIVPVMLSGRW